MAAEAADQGALGDPGPGRECRRRSTSATAWPSSSRWRATTTPPSSSPTRARRPASAASCATSSPWARGRSPALNALRFGEPDHPKTRHLVVRRGRRHRRLRQLLRRADRRRRGQLPPALQRQHPGQRHGRRHRAAPTRSSTRRPPASAIRSSISAPRPAATASTAPPWPRPSSTTTREEKRPTVQVGDPFAEKLLLEACLELMASGAVVAIQDMGAAGLTSSSVEMGAKGDLGIELDLDKVPLREAGMTAYEMMLSESQERMLMVLKPGTRGARPRRSSRSGGSTSPSSARPPTPSASCVKHDGEVDGRPADQGARRRGAGLRPAVHVADAARRRSTPASVPAPMTDAEALLQLIGSPDLARRRWVWEQYDHLDPGQHRAARPAATPPSCASTDGPKGLALTADVTPRYCEADPFEGGKQAVAEAWRNLTAVGAEPLAVTDNLNFGNPERPEIMGQFVGCHPRHRRGLPRARLPGRVRQRLALQRDQRRRRSCRRPTIGGVGLLADVAQARDHRLQGGGRRHHPDRRDRRLARPVALSARDLRPRGGRAAAGRPRRRDAATATSSAA